ncbi:MAG: hypothetical protein ACRDJ2_07145 [Actinomycetota bacterium]
MDAAAEDGGPRARTRSLGVVFDHVAASKRFYTTIAAHAGIRLGDDEPGRAHVRARTTASR